MIKTKILFSDFSQKLDMTSGPYLVHKILREVVQLEFDHCIFYNQMLTVRHTLEIEIVRAQYYIIDVVERRFGWEHRIL